MKNTIVSKNTFQKFFNNPPPIKYKCYFKAAQVRPIKEHLHFLAQIAHESNGLKHNKESHNYSTKRIIQIFGRKYFKGWAPHQIKQKYERKATLLDRVYANRMGNGDEASRDGSKYRGRGYIQLTGKNNYKKFDIQKPHELLDEWLNWIVCFEFWQKNKIDSLCDDNFSDLSDKEIKRITRKINGGYNGYNDRIQKSERIERFYKLKHLHQGIL